MTENLEQGVIHKVDEVRPSAGVEVIQADDLVTAGKKFFTKVRTEKAGAAGNQYAFAETVILHSK